MSQHKEADRRDHEAISLLLPWYVNGTVSAFDRQRIESHTATCEACRQDLELERRIHARVAADVIIEHIPTASLNRLQQRINVLESDPINAFREPRMARRASLPWRGLLAASLVGAILAASFYTVPGWRTAWRGSASPAYYTVTDPQPRPSNEVIRAVFVPSITLAELQALLDEAQMKIVAGPTEAGVYSLAAESSRPVSCVNTRRCDLRR